MKYLYLIRHAKSSWKDSSLHDFDRPLNKRGTRDAPQMGKRLKKMNVKPDMILSSPAVRAKSTAMAIARELAFPAEKILYKEALYHAVPSTMKALLCEVHDDIETLFLLGHNPGLTEFSNRLSRDDIDNIVTCGIYAISLEIVHWSTLQMDGRAKLLFYDYPKRKKA
jgi:phosphohistidine phosphatase